MNRREFVMMTVGGVMLSAAANADEGEQEDKQPVKDEGPTSVDVGAGADYSAEGVSDAFAKAHKLFVVRKGNRLYAPSAICTHKRCALKLRGGMIACPCHRSKYHDDGSNATGPAKAALPRFAISINEQGRIMVDKTRKFEQAEWEAPGAWLELA